MYRGRVLALAAGLAATLAVLTGGVGLGLAFADLRPLVQRWLAGATGRAVTVGALRIDWGNPLVIEIRDLAVANAPWGSEPDMVRIGRLAGQIDAVALARGDWRYVSIEASALRLVMERDAEGRGNWQPGGEDGAQERRAVPTVLRALLHGGLIRYRTSSGRFIEIALDEAGLQAAGDDQPIKLDAAGRYNDIPARLEATMQSFVALRDAAEPFAANLTLANAGVRIAFDGSFTRPLDIDGASGRLDIVARRVGDLTRIFGAPIAIDPGLKIVGDLTRDGDRWRLDQVKGRLGEDVFEGALTLDEGGRAQSDDITVALDFAHLDLEPLLAGSGSGELSLLPEDDAPRIGLRIAAAELDYGRLRAEDAELTARIATGQAAIDALNFALGGGRVTASGHAASVEGGVDVVADLAWSDADADTLARRLGAASGQVAGRFDLRATAHGLAHTPGGLIKAAQGEALLAMTDGLISRDLLEKLSGDLRTLLRKGEGRTQLSCLLGFVTLRGGIARLSPLRLRAAEGAAVGGGQIDLSNQWLDVVLRTERASTNFFALDVPLRLSGKLADLRVTPTTADAVAPYEVALGPLAPDLARIADGNPCRR